MTAQRMVVDPMEQANEVSTRIPLSNILGGAAELLATEPAKAAQQARDILKNVPGQAQALTLLVSALRAQGDTPGARATLESFVAEQPDMAAPHFELGLLLSEIGEHEAAIRALSRVVELEPKHPTAWRALGDELADTGDTEGAAKAYGRQFASSVMDLKMLENMAALEADKVEIADEMIREYLGIFSTDVGAIHMLGHLYLRANRPDTAEKLMARALNLAPDFTTARQDYVSALRNERKWDEENRELDILLEEQPDHSGYRFLKAVALSQSGRTDEAIRYSEALVRDHPGEARYWLAYAFTLRPVGRAEDAIAAFRKSVEIEPGYGETWWGLANLKTFRFSQAEIETMRTQLVRADLPESQRYPLHFALGRALEDNGVYAESFEHYARGNAILHSRNPPGADEIGRGVLREKTRYTEDFFRAHVGHGSPSRDPIFIMGLPRSGSTLVEQILASHSSVEGAGELPVITEMARRLLQMQNARAREDADISMAPDMLDMKALGEEYLSRARTFLKLGRPFFTDKMPSNFHHLGLICAMLPNAAIIDIRRHPLANGFSTFKQIFPAAVSPFYDLGDVGRYYSGYVELMAHFDRILPGRVHRIFYEDLVRNTELEVRRLLDFCGLPFEEACLHFHETRRDIRTSSSEQVRLPIYADSLEQWRHYEPWLGPLKEALGPVLEAYPHVPEGM
jgi:tetratricopeptide (TPR) repeat protein